MNPTLTRGGSLILVRLSVQLSHNPASVHLALTPDKWALLFTQDPHILFHRGFILDSLQLEAAQVYLGRCTVGRARPHLGLQLGRRELATDGCLGGWAF